MCIVYSARIMPTDIFQIDPHRGRAPQELQHVPDKQRIPVSGRYDRVLHTSRDDVLADRSDHTMSPYIYGSREDRPPRYVDVGTWHNERQLYEKLCWQRARNNIESQEHSSERV
jgi:hypothetical protein